MSEYAHLIARGSVHRWFASKDDSDRWRADMRRHARQDRLKIRTSASPHGDELLALAYLPNYTVSEEQFREGIEKMDSLLRELRGDDA